MLPLRRREVLIGLMGTIAGVPVLAASPLESEPVSKALPSPNMLSTESVNLQINYVGGTLVNFGYTTPNGNQPNTHGNTAYLWSVTDPTVPWNRPPEASAIIVGDTPAGDQNFINVNITDNAYIIGYALGPKDKAPVWSPYKKVVASAYIPPSTETRTEFVYKSASLVLQFVGATSLVYQFAFLSGFMAKTSGAWAGLWKNSTVSYTIPPSWFAAIEIDSESGTSGLNGITIEHGATYALGLYVDGFDPDPTKLDLVRLACSVSFST